MLALHARIDRVRAERLLDAAQAAAYPSMGEHGKGFIDGLIERCRGVVAEAAVQVEQVIWNKRVLGTANAIRGQVMKSFGKQAVA